MMEKRQLKQAETDALFSLLMKALDKKTLNSKTAVIYDMEAEKITEIKYLVMHQTADGVLFQIVEKRNAVTFRKKAPVATLVANITVPATSALSSVAESS
jgi:hypothetical protein